MTNLTMWSQADNDDPFQQQEHVAQRSDVKDSSSWHITTNTDQVLIPKWILQTDEERTDQQNAIRAMVSKLKRVKQQKYSTTTSMNYNNIGNPYANDGESDDDTDDYGPAVEDQEGLSLLWQERYTSGGLDEALLHQKKDLQYISSASWLSWCLCCSHSPMD